MTSAAESAPGKHRVQHVVLFRFPTELTDSEEMEFREIIRDWPTKIGTMSHLRLGRDIQVAGDRARGYQYLLFMEFPDVAAVKLYRQHPAHLQLSAFIQPRQCGVLAFDYELSDSTALSDE